MWKRIIRHPLISFFAFLFVFFSISCFGFSLDSFAVSDISVTYNSVPSSYQDVFPTCTGDCLNSYSYLIVEINSPSFGVPYSNMFNIRFDGSFERNFGVSVSSSFSIYKLPFDGHSNNFLSFKGNLSSDVFDAGITFTLTDSYQSCSVPSGSLSITENGTYDVSSYAEAVVDVPASVVEGDYHDDLVSIKYAILIGVASLFVIYFFFCIYRMLLRGTS